MWITNDQNSLVFLNVYLIVSQVEVRKCRAFPQWLTRKHVKVISGNTESFQRKADLVKDFNRKWRHIVVAEKEILELTQIAERWRQCVQAVALKIDLYAKILNKPTIFNVKYKKSIFYLTSLICPRRSSINNSGSGVSGGGGNIKYFETKVQNKNWRAWRRWVSIMVPNCVSSLLKVTHTLWM